MKPLLKGNSLQKVLLAAAAGLLTLSQGAVAGTKADKMPAPVQVKEEPFVTGNVTVNYETAFISYGQDVWGVGDSWSKSFIHPSAELDFNLGKGLQFYVNTWWDVNDYATTNIGKYIQEIDVNTGFYYTMDKWKFQLGYGAWMYASQTEQIIDGKVSYSDGFWNPFVMLHGRVAIGSNIGFSTGLVGQVGCAPTKTWGKLTASLPVTVSFDTDNFHGGGAGFAYVSAGPVFSYALTKHVGLNLAATYYHTNDAVIPGNPADNFVLGTAGFTVSF
jgi:hypothetical protein